MELGEAEPILKEIVEAINFYANHMNIKNIRMEFNPIKAGISLERTVIYEDENNLEEDIEHHLKDILSDCTEFFSFELTDKHRLFRNSTIFDYIEGVYKYTSEITAPEIQ